MRGSKWLVNSDKSCDDFVEFAKDVYKDNKWVTFTYQIGKQRTLPQNVLFQVWARQLAAHIMNCKSKDVPEGDHEDMKRALKSGYYRFSGEQSMIRPARKNPLTGEIMKPVPESSKDYERGVMFNFMEWIQNYAADTYKCYLESAGEYQDLKVSQHDC